MRTRELVVEVAVVNVWDIDTRIVIMVGTRERDELAILWFSGPTTTDGELRARWVEFGATHAYCKLECNNFVADEVVSGSNIGRKCNASGSTSH